MNDVGYIKLYRSIRRWEWWDDRNVRDVFLSLLMEVNYTQGTWRGITINPGQTVITVSHLSVLSGVKPTTIRRAFERLKNSGELAIETASDHHLITVMNWALYQQDTEIVAKDLANERQQSGEQVELKRRVYKNIKKEEHNIAYGKFKNVMLSDDEKLEVSDAEIENLSGYMESTGKKYKSHYATILNWRRKNEPKETQIKEKFITMEDFG